MILTDHKGRTYHLADGLKRCSACHAIKVAAEYHRDASAPDGLNHRCRNCEQARWRARRADRMARDVAQEAEQLARDLLAAGATRDQLPALVGLRLAETYRAVARSWLPG